MFVKTIRGRQMIYEQYHLEDFAGQYHNWYYFVVAVE